MYNKKIYLVLLLLFTLSGCLPHSFGNKNLTLSPTHNKTLSTGKNAYIAVTRPLPSELSEKPEYIAVQFAKFFSPVCASAYPGGYIPEKETIIKNAQEQQSDYAVLLKITQWEEGSFIDPGPKADVQISILDVASGDILHESSIKTTCPVMLFGQEQSPRECIRPQVEQWILSTFATEVTFQPYSDPSTFPNY